MQQKALSLPSSPSEVVMSTANWKKVWKSQALPWCREESLEKSSMEDLYRDPTGACSFIVVRDGGGWSLCGSY